LRGDVGGHRRGNVDRVGQERAQESDGAQLHREPEPVVAATPGVDELPIGRVEVEVAVQLSRSRILGVAAGSGPVEAGQDWLGGIDIISAAASS
jgi:hypothetical protein